MIHSLLRGGAVRGGRKKNKEERRKSDERKRDTEDSRHVREYTNTNTHTRVCSETRWSGDVLRCV